MLFMNLAISLLGLSASVAAFTINSPSAASYWVQFSSNTIAWSPATNDPSLVSLQITHPNTTFLNGIFAIAEYVPASLESYTVTNVTLIVGDGYVVQMVNPTNSTQILATSGPFSVKPAGTSPAAGSTAGVANGMSRNVANGNMTGMNGNMTGMGGNNANGTSRNSTSGFNNTNNGTATRNGANSAASSLVSLSFSTLLLVASAVGCTIAL